MTASFVDKVVVLTGGTRGIGRATALLLARHGASVFVLARSVAEGVEDIGPGRIAGIATDVAREEQVGSAVRAVLAATGRVDVLVNNAGIARDAMVHKMTSAQMREVLDVNLMGTWSTMREVLPHMRAQRSGVIVNISSIAGKAGNLGQGNYSASKEAVTALSKSAARESAAFGIRVNVVRPGFIDTELTAGIPEAARSRLTADIPLQRPGTPEEVAQAVAFLASDEASYVTGAVLDVSGGRYM